MNLNQNQLEILNDIIADNPTILFDDLGIDVRTYGSSYSSTCPCHDGDNPRALYVKNNLWRCFTRGCEKTFRNSLIGLARGVLSNKEHNWSAPGDKVFSFYKTIDYLIRLYEVSPDSLKVDETKREMNNWVRQGRNLLHSSKRIIHRDKLKDMLDIPSPYYLQRGFSKEVLEKYAVGECNNPNKPMFHRAVFPIFQDEWVVGYSGRSVNGRIPKWRHNDGFNTSQNFYNLWSSREHIEKKKTAIILEGPGDCLKMEMAGVHYSLGVFGHSLSPYHEFILATMGVLKLIVGYDADKAGEQGKFALEKQYGKFYNLEYIPLQDNDVGGLTVEEIKGLNL